MPSYTDRSLTTEVSPGRRVTVWRATVPEGEVWSYHRGIRVAAIDPVPIVIERTWRQRLTLRIARARWATLEFLFGYLVVLNVWVTDEDRRHYLETGSQARLIGMAAAVILAYIMVVVGLIAVLHTLAGWLPWP